MKRTRRTDESECRVRVRVCMCVNNRGCVVCGLVRSGAKSTNRLRFGLIYIHGESRTGLCSGRDFNAAAENNRRQRWWWWWRRRRRRRRRGDRRKTGKKKKNAYYNNNRTIETVLHVTKKRMRRASAVKVPDVARLTPDADFLCTDFFFFFFIPRSVEIPPAAHVNTSTAVRDLNKRARTRSPRNIPSNTSRFSSLCTVRSPTCCTANV